LDPSDARENGIAIERITIEEDHLRFMPLTLKAVLLSVIGIAALAAAPVASAQNYNPCSNPVQAHWCDSAPEGSDITLTSANLNPDPLVPGMIGSLTMTYFDAQTYTITSATYTLVVNRGSKTILDKSGNGCPILAAVFGETCPVAPFAAQTRTLEGRIPKIPKRLKRGIYSGSLTLTDQLGNTIQGIHFEVPLP
jgi:hypothetical protein